MLKLRKGEIMSGKEWRRQLWTDAPIKIKSQTQKPVKSLKQEKICQCDSKPGFCLYEQYPWSICEPWTLLIQRNGVSYIQYFAIKKIKFNGCLYCIYNQKSKRICTPLIHVQLICTSKTSVLENWRRSYLHNWGMLYARFRKKKIT